MKTYHAKLQRVLDITLKKINLSRKKFIISLIMSIIKCGTVKFTSLAEELNHKLDSSSNLRRIQSFFASYVLDYDMMAKFFLSFLPLLKLDLSLDRTNWKFGGKDFNILVLAASYKGTAVPIYYEMLDKQGNSNQSERIDLLEKFIASFGVNRIRSLSADREFIGAEWLGYLENKNIPFYIRLKGNTRVSLGGICYPASDLVKLFAVRKKKIFHNVSIWKSSNLILGLKYLPQGNKNEKAESDNLIILSNRADRCPIEMYHKRWSIETFFQSIKKRGVDIEQSHLKSQERLKMLFTLVAITFVLCLKTGVWKNDYIKTIEVKRNGYKQNSYFRYGFDYFKKILRNVTSYYSKIEALFDTIYQDILKTFSTLIRV